MDEYKPGFAADRAVAEFDVDQFWATEAEMKRVAWELQNAQAQLESARREGAAAARAAKLAGHRITDISRQLGVNRTTADKWSAGP